MLHLCLALWIFSHPTMKTILVRRQSQSNLWKKSSFLHLVLFVLSLNLLNSSSSSCGWRSLSLSLSLSDIDTLETVLDTIAFGDIQGEDTRNFTEANFVKLFRLSQLMVGTSSSSSSSSTTTSVSSMLSLTHSCFFSQQCIWNLFSWNGNGGVGGLPFSNEEFAGGVFVACARALGNTQVWANLSRSKYATERRKVESSMCWTASCSSPVPSWVEASSQGSTILLPILSLFFFAKEHNESLLQKHMHASLLQKSMHHLSHRRAGISLEEEHVSVHKGFQIQGSSFLQSVIVFVSSFWSEDDRICVFLLEIILQGKPMEVEQSKHAATLTKKSDHLEREREHIFEILGLTKICLFWNGFVWSVLLHHQKQISYICTEVMKHHTESEWFWTGTEIAHLFFGGCQTMKTYEVMLKMQGKCHMQSNTQQVRQYNIRKTNEISILHVAKKLLYISLSLSLSLSLLLILYSLSQDFHFAGAELLKSILILSNGIFLCWSLWSCAGSSLSILREDVWVIVLPCKSTFSMRDYWVLHHACMWDGFGCSGLMCKIFWIEGFGCAMNLLVNLFMMDKI